MRIWASLMFITLLAGCSQDALLEKFTSPEEQARVTAYVDLLRTRHFSEIEAVMDPSLKSPTLRGTLMQMADLLPSRDPVSKKLVGVRRMHNPQADSVNITFEYDFGGAWLLINVAMQESGGTRSIVGFNVTPEAQSLESQNRFTLSNKSALQYTVLALAPLAALLTLYALVVCIRTRLAGRKWPWVLFILFGFGNLSVNWNTGQWGLTPLALQLFSASASAQIYSPWNIAVSLPIGAICFLLLRQKLRAQSQ